MAKADGGTFYSRAYRAASIFGAMLLGLVAGCATPSTAISEKTDLNINQGVVTLRVVNLHERSLKYVKIQNVETLEEVILVPQATLGGDSYRFTGIVAAGRYKTKEIHGSDVDDFGVVRIHHSLKLPMDQDAANRFNVASGQLTNLGSVVVTPVQGERFVAPREGTPVAALEWLQYANPGLAAKLDPKRELGWLEPVSSAVKELNRQQISYAQTKAVATTVPLVDSKGTAWGGGKLGLVEDLGSSIRYHTGTVHQILSVAPLKDGRILAAGEEGYIAVSSPDRKSWKQITAPVSKASVALLVTQAPDGTVYLACRSPLGLTVHSASPDDFAWRELRRIERDTMAASADGAMVRFASLGQAKPAAVATRERLVVYTPDPELLSSYDFQNRSWEVHKPTTSVVRMRATPDGLVYVVNAMPSIWATPDYGKSWSKVDRYTNTTMPVFANVTTGYVLALPFNTWSGRPALYKTVDGGNTWAAVGATPETFSWRGQLAYDQVNRRIAYQHPSGGLRWTEDEGKTWR